LLSSTFGHEKHLADSYARIELWVLGAWFRVFPCVFPCLFPCLFPSLNRTLNPLSVFPCLSAGRNFAASNHVWITVSLAKWRMFKKCSLEIRFARRPDARLLYPTLTGGHQVYITRKGDPALRLLTNRGQENHLFASSVSPTKAHLDLQQDT